MTSTTPGDAAADPAGQMMSLLFGFQISQALYALSEAGVVTALDDGPLPVAELARRTGTDPDVLARLVRTLAPLGVFATDGDRVRTTDVGATLSAHHPAGMGALAAFFMRTHYRPFEGLLHNLRTGETAAEHELGETFFDWILSTPERANVMTRAMAALATGLRAEVLDDHPLPPGDVIADIGGADGTVLARLLRDEPDRRGIVFDRPEVAAAAHDVLAGAGLTDRVEVVGGDFFDGVPAADVYVVASVLHDWHDDACLRILGSVRAAAAPGARLVVIEQVVPDGDGPHPSKLGDLTMLAMVGGKERSAAEWERLLDDGGFTLDRIVPTRTPVSVLEATLR